MTYRLDFEIFDLPKMANVASGKSHWRYAHSEVKKWNRLVAEAVTIGGSPDKPLLEARLTLIRCSSKMPDYDGLVRGFKSVVDGLVKAGVLADDKLSNTGAWDCRWIKAHPKHGKIKVTVEEIA